MHSSPYAALVGEQGISLPPGMHTVLAMQREEQTSLAEPYGDCNSTDSYSQAQCLLHCYGDIVQRECGCVAPYMKHNKGMVSIKSLFYHIIYVSINNLERCIFEQSQCEYKRAYICTPQLLL